MPRRTAPRPATQTLAIDTAPPATPAITSPALSNDPTPLISGTAEAGSTVTVTVAGVSYTTVALGGVWSIDLGTATPVIGTLSLNLNGANAVAVTATDAAGNASPPASQVLTLDTAIPAIPSVPVLAPASDSGVPGDNITNQATPTLTGQGGEVGSTITLTDTTGGSAVVLGTALVDSDGKWSFVPPASLSAGLHSITVTATDAAGNASPASAPLALVLYPTAPGAPTLVSQAPRSGSQQPVLSGTSVAGDTVLLFSGGEPIGSALVGPDGTWSFTYPEALPVGSYEVTAKATDPAGNLSGASAPVTVAVVADGTYSVGVADASGGTVRQVYDAGGVLTTITKSSADGLVQQAVTASTALRNIYNDQGVLIGTITQPVAGITEQPEFDSTGLPRAANSTTSTAGSVITFTAQSNVVTTQGNDTVIANGDSATIFALGASTTVQAGYGSLTFVGGSGTSTVLGGTGTTVAFGGTGGGTLQGGSAGKNVLVSGGGSTTLIGGGTGDLLVAGGGNTTIVAGSASTAFGGGGTSTIFAGAGSTVVGGDGSSTMVADKGNTSMWGGSGQSFMWGGSGDVVFGGGSGTAVMVGGSGNNIFVGGTGQTTARGGSGNDTFFTGRGKMDITEGGGRNIVAFGSGTASVTSGAGATTYLFSAGTAGGNDLIAGFTVGQDRLALYNYDLSKVQTSVAGGNTAIALTDGTRITLVGVTASNVNTLF